MALTEKQKRFCDYYIECGNGAEAARRAGYKAKNLYQLSSENLTKPYIKAYIEEKLEKKDKKRIMSQDRVLELYSRIAEGKEKDVFVSYDKEGNVIENKIEPTLKERIKALDALAKRYGIDKMVEEKSEEVIKFEFKRS